MATRHHPNLRQRFAEAIKERDEASATCMLLIGALEGLIERFKKCMLHNKSVPDETMAEIAVTNERAAIRKARRGR